MGNDLQSNLESLTELVRESQLPAGQRELAVIVGAARAISDLGGRNVTACLRLREPDETEFRILADRANEMDGWMTLAEFESRAREVGR